MSAALNRNRLVLARRRAELFMGKLSLISAFLQDIATDIATPPFPPGRLNPKAPRSETRDRN
jgi:hypothetical protein